MKKNSYLCTDLDKRISQDIWEYYKKDARSIHGLKSLWNKEYILISERLKASKAQK